MKSISFIVPCYNESANIPVLKSNIDALGLPYDLTFIFVDDGSTDDTQEVLARMFEEDNRVKFISLSRNFGHQNALKAGIDKADGDCIITMDADMQHSPEVIVEMIEKWNEGYEIVFAKCLQSSSLPLMKRFTSSVYKKLFRYLSDLPGQAITSDFRLLDRMVAEELKMAFGEYHLFYRGIIPWMGFKQYELSYKQADRYKGESKYTYSKMGHLALNGITSFSTKPLRLITLLGAFLSLIAFIYGGYALYITLFTDKAITGWASVILSILLIGGLQLLFLGIIGEYLAKMFFEIKRRPHYLVRKTNL